MMPLAIKSLVEGFPLSLPIYPAKPCDVMYRADGGARGKGSGELGGTQLRTPPPMYNVISMLLPTVPH